MVTNMERVNSSWIPGRLGILPPGVESNRDRLHRSVCCTQSAGGGEDAAVKEGILDLAPDLAPDLDRFACGGEASPGSVVETQEIPESGCDGVMQDADCKWVTNMKRASFWRIPARLGILPPGVESNQDRLHRLVRKGKTPPCTHTACGGEGTEGPQISQINADATRRPAPSSETGFDLRNSAKICGLIPVPSRALRETQELPESGLHCCTRC